MGHGHVTPNADGSRARCGGPSLCRVCQREAAALKDVRGAPCRQCGNPRISDRENECCGEHTPPRYQLDGRTPSEREQWEHGWLAGFQAAILRRDP